MSVINPADKSVSLLAWLTTDLLFTHYSLMTLDSYIESLPSTNWRIGWTSLPTYFRFSFFPLWAPLVAPRTKLLNRPWNFALFRLFSASNSIGT